MNRNTNGRTDKNTGGNGAGTAGGNTAGNKGGNTIRNKGGNTTRNKGRSSGRKRSPAGGSERGCRKNRRGRQQLLLLAAAFATAVIFLFLARFGPGGGQQEAGGAGTGSGKDSAGMTPAGARGTGPELDSMAGQAAAKEDPELAAWMEPAGESGEIENLIFNRTGAESDASSAGPLEKIAFTAGNNNRFQRSFPVQIDAGNLGGTEGTLCWAVFLPEDMTGHPCILFSDYTEVSLVPLPEGERLNGAKLLPEDKDRAGDKADQAARTYASGDVVSGLWNGSAFRVHMTGADGSVQEENLYVFSCRGTASMYLDTESGSMTALDGDKLKQTSEAAEYLVCTPDGAADCAGFGSVSGRGNSSWMMPKRPYNLNLSEKQSVLGLPRSKKLCLISNSFDRSNLLDRVSAQLALNLQMRDTPQGEYVNLFLNGKYNGLYYLSQRPRTGGSVKIEKLDNRILKANGITGAEQETAWENEADDRDTGLEETGNPASSGNGDLTLPERIPLHKKGDKLKKWAYDWKEEPEDNTGGYLLQQYDRYDGTGCWFSTEHRRFRVISPAWPTAGEVSYLQDYTLCAERAIYSEDGTDPETGKSIGEFLDLPSWEDMFLLEEYFAEWDAERWSFYITKDRDDPLLYCGPMWDFDHSAGTMLYGRYPETAVSLLMLRDTRHGWMNRLLTHPEFERDLHTRWQGRFSPAVHEYLDGQYETEVSAVESAAYMNNIRRGNENDFRTDAEQLRTWLQRRAAFLDEYVEDPGAFCRVLYSFSWGDLSHYVRRGEPLGYLPLPEYGETQVESQIEKNEIIGWQDEDGNPVGADIVIDRDRAFSPVYK